MYGWMTKPGKLVIQNVINIIKIKLYDTNILVFSKLISTDYSTLNQILSARKKPRSLKQVLRGTLTQKHGNKKKTIRKDGKNTEFLSEFVIKRTLYVTSVLTNG